MATPRTARVAAQSFTWRQLDHVLRRTHPAPDVLVVTRGRAVEVDAPRGDEQLKALFAKGIGIVVRDVEHACSAVAAIAEAIRVELPGKQRVLAFATPKGTHGFGWHYDAEDVLILQTAGSKEYYFRANTLDPDPQYGSNLDFDAFPRETSPMMRCVLVSGDWLYLPRGYWHVAQPLSDALSLSIGIRSVG